MNKDYFYEIALNLLDGVGAVTARQLISYCGSAENIFKLKKDKLLKIPQIGNQTAETIIKKESLQKAEDELLKVEKYGVSMLYYLNENYPLRLKNLYDAPIILYCKGEANWNNPKSVAIVGTRDASEYGKAITEEIVKDLQVFNPLIVSGLAYGIDIFAHRASLKNGLATVAVMASGLDIIYPAVHKKTAEQMIEQQGAVITENPFGTKPDANRFPARNRIIAGLADAVIVIEAKSKGGALITAEIANNYNRDVFAIPGNLHSKTSEGCNQLIKTHKAHLLTSVKDFEYFMNWGSPDNKTPIQRILDFEGLNLEEIEMNILNLFKENNNKEMLIDEISWKLQLSVSQVNAFLLNLELLGLVKALPGKKFTLF